VGGGRPVSLSDCKGGGVSSRSRREVKRGQRHRILSANTDDDPPKGMKGTAQVSGTKETARKAPSISSRERGPSSREEVGAGTSMFGGGGGEDETQRSNLVGKGGPRINNTILRTLHVVGFKKKSSLSRLGL